ncbi:MAG TPA: DUF1579 family protein [Myxococcota bacterium]|nr:DUF1579 family protein [Myxococcota bacterium]
MLNVIAAHAITLAATFPLAGLDAGLTAVPDSAALSYYEGNWTCEGDSNADAGAAHHEKGQLQVTRKARGLYVYVWASEPSGADAEGRKVISLAGYDPLGRRLVRIGISSQGGFAHLTSDGWSGDTFAWEGIITAQGGDRMTVRATDTKVDDDTFETRLDVAKGDGDWTTAGSGTCTRVTP